MKYFVIFSAVVVCALLMLYSLFYYLVYCCFRFDCNLISFTQIDFSVLLNFANVEVALYTRRHSEGNRGIGF